MKIDESKHHSKGQNSDAISTGAEQSQPPRPCPVGLHTWSNCNGERG